MRRDQYLAQHWLATFSNRSIFATRSDVGQNGFFDPGSETTPSTVRARTARHPAALNVSKFFACVCRQIGSACRYDRKRPSWLFSGIRLRS